MSRYLDYKSEEADDELGNSVDSTQSNNKKTMSVLYYLHTQSLGLSAVSLPNKIKIKEVSTIMSCSEPHFDKDFTSQAFILCSHLNPGQNAMTTSPPCFPFNHLPLYQQNHSNKISLISCDYCHVSPTDLSF